MFVTKSKYDKLKVDFDVCQLKLQLTQTALENAQKQLTELGFKNFNQRSVIARLNKIIKELKNGQN